MNAEKIVAALLDEEQVEFAAGNPQQREAAGELDPFGKCSFPAAPDRIYRFLQPRGHRPAPRANL
jgi:hypothetical protein